MKVFAAAVLFLALVAYTKAVAVSWLVALMLLCVNTIFVLIMYIIL